MKNVAALSIILASGLDYNDPALDPSQSMKEYTNAPLIIDRPEYNTQQPVIVTPVAPSDTGSSYIGNDAIHTPKMDCYRSAAGGALICNAR